MKEGAAEARALPLSLSALLAASDVVFAVVVLGGLVAVGDGLVLGVIAEEEEATLSEVVGGMASGEPCAGAGTAG